MAKSDGIPLELLPHEEQVPPFITTTDERARFDLCFALTRLIAQRDDPVFCRQLYFSDMKTGDLEAQPGAGEQ